MRRRDGISVEKVAYPAVVYCANCQFEGSLLIAFGVQVREASCAHCGCTTLYVQPRSMREREA